MVQPWHRVSYLWPTRRVLFCTGMAKATNHTAHNQSYKNHRNGIKKPFALKKGQRRPMKGVSQRTVGSLNCAECGANACLGAVDGMRSPWQHFRASITI